MEDIRIYIILSTNKEQISVIIFTISVGLFRELLSVVKTTKQ